ncbi:ribonuclease H-like domain-containing protein [Tanacetum coccineum]
MPIPLIDTPQTEPTSPTTTVLKTSHIQTGPTPSNAQPDPSHPPNNTGPIYDAPIRTDPFGPTTLGPNPHPTTHNPSNTITTEPDTPLTPASISVSQPQSTLNDNPNPTSVHPMVTCFRVGTNRPTQCFTLHVSSISPLSKSYNDAFNDTLSRYKARLVANGSTQIKVHQFDVKNAFLHGDLFDTMYMHQPSGFWDSACPNHRIIASLHQELSMTDLISLNYFLGISVTLNSSGMFLSQRKYDIEILVRAHMVGCNSSRTPVDTASKLGDDGDPVFDPTLHRSLAGSLQYPTFTRPDISYAVQQVCLYMHDPQEPHFSAVKRILRYVRGSLDYGLQLFSSSTTSLVAYSDANWAGCPTTRKSTSGYCVFLGNNLLLWSSKRQLTLSRSSAEAEYRGVANAFAETCWLRNLLCELHTPLSS